MTLTIALFRRYGLCAGKSDLREVKFSRTLTSLSENLSADTSGKTSRDMQGQIQQKCSSEKYFKTDNPHHRIARSQPQNSKNLRTNRGLSPGNYGTIQLSSFSSGLSQ